MNPTHAPSLPNGLAPLNHLGVIRVQGDDAVSFLHGQITHDVALLPVGGARLSAYLSPKGRMLASFVLLKTSAQEVLLVCDRSVLPATLKRLSMFVLRAKAKLTDATSEFTLAGLLGDAVSACSGDAQAAAWQVTQREQAWIVTLPPAPQLPRALWIAPSDQPRPAGQAVTDDQWAWAEVQSGVATLQAGVVDQFVPQMLNYESVDGVSFKKGCYPGQEVVARSQFRGAIKRRTYVAHTDSTDAALVAAGTEVYTAADLEQPCGLVVQSAPAPNQGTALLVAIQTAAADQPLQLGADANAPTIQLQALPYSLAEDI